MRRRCVPLLLVVWMTLTLPHAFRGQTFGPTPAREASLKAQRNRLWERAKARKSEGKLAEAADVGEQMLAVERAWLGDDDQEIVVSLEWLADIYEAAEGIDWVWEHRIDDLAEFGV